MAIRKQQEMELQAALHGAPIKKQRILPPTESPAADLDRQLREGIVKGLPIKIVKRKK
ncbi:unnamed protein product [marine sediment metagenome]|uniref:Uncharacterized protein n=1 Tax=marine sediment metagenome TaxID=412755 RepID=X1L338_9ZZZZ